MSVLWTADNAETALKNCRENPPDILLTDINMPELSGLDLLERLKDEFPAMLLLVISGYDDFRFAQRAVSLHVFEYILKPIDMAQLADTLRRAKEKLEERKKKLQGSQAMNLQYVLAELMTGHLEKENLSDPQRQLLQPLAGSPFCVLILHFAEQLVSSRYRGIYQELKPALRCDQFWLFPQDEKEYAILLWSHNVSLKEDALASAQHLIEIYSLRKVSVAIAVGKPVPAVYQLALSWRDAHTAILSRLIEGMGKVFWQESDVVKSRINEHLESADYQKRIVNLVVSNQIDGLPDAIRVLARDIQDCGAEQSFYTQNTIYGIFSALQDAMQQLHLVNPIEVKPMAFTEAVMKYPTLSDVLFHLEDELMELALQLAETRRNDLGSSINKGILYMQSHFQNKDLQLEQIAAAADVSISYFCSLFKKETGISCIDYLTNFRIKEAKRLLLQTNYKIHQISDMAGYASQSYFNTIFKKHTGSSPAAFRVENKKWNKTQCPCFQSSERKQGHCSLNCLQSDPIQIGPEKMIKQCNNASDTDHRDHGANSNGIAAFPCRYHYDACYSHTGKI